MADIFISTRHGDDADAIRVIVESLRAAWPAKVVFWDDDSLTLGDHFPSRIEEALRGCPIVLVVIGPKWSSPENVLRLADDGDWVCWEIRTSLEQQSCVVPVFLDGASLPAASRLPERISRICTLHGIYIRTGRHLAGDVNRLIAKLRKVVGDGRAEPRRPSEPARPRTSTPRVALESPDYSQSAWSGTLPTGQAATSAKPGGVVSARPLAGTSRVPAASPFGGVYTLALPDGEAIELAWCPGGEFVRGQPTHSVGITRGFYAGIRPVTWPQWRAVMGADDGGADRGPVEGKSWSDARPFCDALTAVARDRVCEGWRVDVRLLTEAEWDCIWRVGAADIRVCYDTLGLEYEWCEDGLFTFTDAPQLDPVGPHGPTRVVRRTLSGRERECSKVERVAIDAGRAWDGLGFRICLAFQQVEQPATQAVAGRGSALGRFYQSLFGS
jgi:hypothetical protein